MNLFDLERMVARSQLALSFVLIIGHYILIALTAMKVVDESYLHDSTQLVSLVVFYWFQRQRPQSATDAAQNGNTPQGAAPNPTLPQAAAK